MPRSAHSASSAARSAPLAATPPVSTMRLIPSRGAARTVLRTSIFTTVAWNEARDVGHLARAPSGPCWRT